MQFEFKVWCAKWWGKWQEYRYRYFLRNVYGVIHVGANSGQERAKSFPEARWILGVKRALFDPT